MTTTLDIEKLRELHEKATQGPWIASPLGDFGRVNIRPDEAIGFPVAFTGTKRPRDVNEANAALIAYVRTHLPEILERLSRT